MATLSSFDGSLMIGKIGTSRMLPRQHRRGQAKEVASAARQRHLRAGALVRGFPGPSGKVIGATRYHVAEGDWGRTLQRMLPASVNYAGHRDWDCLAFLRETTLLPA